MCIFYDFSVSKKHYFSFKSNTGNLLFQLYINATSTAFYDSARLVSLKSVMKHLQKLCQWVDSNDPVLSFQSVIYDTHRKQCKGLFCKRNKK